MSLPQFVSDIRIVVDGYTKNVVLPGERLDEWLDGIGIINIALAGGVRPNYRVRRAPLTNLGHCSVTTTLKSLGDQLLLKPNRRKQKHVVKTGPSSSYRILRCVDISYCRSELKLLETVE